MTQRVFGDPECTAELHHKNAGVCDGTGSRQENEGSPHTVVGDGFGRTLLRLRVPLLVL